MTTVWDAQDGRWWVASVVLFAAGGVAMTVLLGIVTRLDPWSLLALLVVPVGWSSAARARARVRLTPEGVEVRGLRTTVLRYADIESVEVAPEWDGARAVWVRMRGSWPTAAPEVLAPPPEWWRAPGRSLEDVVRQIQERVDAARGQAPA